MNLNRNNYEEFFLLYVDGELNPQQMQQVEDFVKTNPDLQQELDMLKDAVLSIDNETVFADKSSLYKSVDESSINSNNYQENFLLYVDGELDTTAKAGVETFVLQNPALQDEFTLLKQTKLQPEFVACPDKESLYKKEERPVVFMWTKRLSVAAAILFFAVIAWMLVPNSKPTAGTNQVAANDGNKNNNNRKTAPTVTSTPANTSSTGTKENTDNGQKQPVVDEKANTAIAVNKGNKNNVTNKVGTKIQSPAPQQLPSNIEPQNTIASTQTSIEKKQEQQFSSIPKDQQIVAVNSSKKDNIIAPAINNSNVSLLAQPAVYRELNTDEEQEAKTVYIGSMEIKKDKINGLFKKAKKLFAKKQSEETPAKEAPGSPTRTIR